VAYRLQEVEAEAPLVNPENTVEIRLVSWKGVCALHYSAAQQKSYFQALVLPGA
jgi:hypothetical protein